MKNYLIVTRKKFTSASWFSLGLKRSFCFRFVFGLVPQSFVSGRQCCRFFGPFFWRLCATLVKLPLTSVWTANYVRLFPAAPSRTAHFLRNAPLVVVCLGDFCVVHFFAAEAGILFLGSVIEAAKRIILISCFLFFIILHLLFRYLNRHCCLWTD